MIQDNTDIEEQSGEDHGDAGSEESEFQLVVDIREESGTDEDGYDASGISVHTGESDPGLDRGTKTGDGGSDGKNGSTRNGEYRVPTISAHTGGCAGSEGASVVV